MSLVSKVFNAACMRQLCIICFSRHHATKLNTKVFMTVSKLHMVLLGRPKCLGFFVSSYRKTEMKFLGHRII